MTFDPLVEERMTDGVVIPRNPSSGNPFIVPRGETDAIEYTRASSLSEFLVKDIFALKKWEMRYLAQGLGRNPDLAAWAATQHYSTGPITGTLPLTKRKEAAAQLDEIINMALERVGIHEAANAGSVVHAATEPGAPVDPLPDLMANAVKEYHILTAGLERVASEVFTANDIVRAAGTFDSGYISPEFPEFIVCGDTKTGKGYHQAEFEIQLAVYSRGEVYLGGPVCQNPGVDPEDLAYEDQRIPFVDYFGLPMHPKVGYLVHVPLEGKPKPRIVKLDLDRGWRLALCAAATRDARHELDKVGIGEKVKHNELAITVMREKFDELLAWRDDEYRELQSMQHQSDVDVQFSARARELYRRFAHIWPQQYTDEVKERTS